MPVAAVLIFLTILNVVEGQPFLFDYEPELEPPFVKPIIKQTDLQMPGVTPLKNDTYLCTSFALNNDETYYLIGFDPISDIKGVHHVLLFGCEAPGSQEVVWNCGEMTHHSGNNHLQREKRAPTCTSQPSILYAWAHDAPKLQLPKGVGFKVGGQTNSNYLVLQVHYMHETNKEDHSGVQVVSTLEPQPRTAATLLMVTGGEIQPNSEEQLEVACVVDEAVKMHPFAFRVHTHRHGTKVGGWVVRENPANGQDEWIKLGERNPQLPQLFERVADKSIVVAEGDILAARCNIKNEENRKIEVGPTSEDEMCNFYMMYWVEGEDVLENHICYSPGSPTYKWAKEAGLNHLPH